MMSVPEDHANLDDAYLGKMKSSPKFGSLESDDFNSLKHSEQTAENNRFQPGPLSVIESEEYNEFTDSELGDGQGIETLKQGKDGGKKQKKGKNGGKKNKEKGVKKNGMCSAGPNGDKACCAIF